MPLKPKLDLAAEKDHNTRQAPRDGTGLNGALSFYRRPRIAQSTSLSLVDGGHARPSAINRAITSEGPLVSDGSSISSPGRLVFRSGR